MRYSPQFVRMFTEKMMTYALGQAASIQICPRFRSIVRDVASENNRFSSLVLGVARSAQFQMRVKEAVVSTQ